ncbi:MAG: ribosome small subunit-dependent GTPase A [Thermaerobacter sp.]|nr:ribosome small subunit-dependent GTPase A [Thermaerobacter sp.]
MAPGVRDWGLVTLLEANRPTVVMPDGRRYLCHLRGRVKRDVGRIVVGDAVQIAPTDAGEAIILQVAPRRNQLLRPLVANLDGVFAVFSLNNPRGSLELLDKRLVLAHLIGCEAEIMLTKADLSQDPDERRAVVKAYRQAGYRVWDISARTGQGLDGWTAEARSGVWVMTGESGVGKSSVLQFILPDAGVASAALSRGGRGQQTTRWVRLYRVAEFWLADTPGYTALTTTIEGPQQLLGAFREWEGIDCRYADCQHRDEAGCGVIRAVAAGEVADWRHRHYRVMVDNWVRRH